MTIPLPIPDPCGDYKPTPLACPRWQNDLVYDEAIGEDTGTINNDPSLTQQHFTKDADLNEIVRRFGIHDGAIPPVILDARFFGDFSDVPDFRTALDLTRDAVNKFNALPHAIRSRFSNDPVTFHDWVMNPLNLEEAIKLGILSREAPPPLTPNTGTGALSPSNSPVSAST